MGFFDPLIKQLRKPTGWLGLWTAKAMNLSHCKLTDWGLGHIQINNDDTILDIGCGGGRTTAGCLFQSWIQRHKGR